MYTSGWPKSQNRCWYSSGSPPAAAWKKFVPKLRSKNTMISAAVTIGIANSVRNATTSIIHTNTGMRMSVMPGRAHVEDRDDEVDRGRRRPDAEHDRGRRPRSRGRARAGSPPAIGVLVSGV